MQFTRSNAYQKISYFKLRQIICFGEMNAGFVLSWWWRCKLRESLKCLWIIILGPSISKPYSMSIWQDSTTGHKAALQGILYKVHHSTFGLGLFFIVWFPMMENLKAAAFSDILFATNSLEKVFFFLVSTRQCICAQSRVSEEMIGRTWLAYSEHWPKPRPPSDTLQMNWTVNFEPGTNAAAAEW